MGEATKSLKEHLLIYLINEYLLSIYHIADIALVVEDTTMNNDTDKMSAPMEHEHKFY